jgi:hypothetical protein
VSERPPRGGRTYGEEFSGMSSNDVEPTTVAPQYADRGVAGSADHVPGLRAGRAAQARDARNSRIALVLVVLLGAALVALHIHSYRQLSVYDEVQHVDYVYRLLEGEIPASGDHWVPSTVDAVTCRTIDYPAQYPPCRQAAGYASLPNSGFTTAFIHTPAYYLLPAAAVWVSAALPFDLDQISVMRATGVLWLAGALVLMWLMWRDLRVPWQVRAGLALILVATPAVLLAHSTVTNDATGLAAGAAVTLATLRWDQGRLRLWVPVVVAALALALKATSLAVLLLACAFVLVRGLQRASAEGRTWQAAATRRNLAFVGSLALASAVIGLGWSMVSTARATLDERLIPQNLTLMADRFEWSWLTTSLLSMTSPLSPQFLQSALQGTIGVSIGNLVNVGLLALAVVGAVRSEPGSVVRALAIATGASMLAFGPLLTLINYASLGVQFGIPARYGFTLVPALATLGATAVRSRRGGLALIAVGLAFCAAVAWHLIR